MVADIVFRSCDRADYPACARIGAAAFALDAGALDRNTNGVPAGIYEAAVEVSDGGCTYGELAIINGEIAGFIFGRIDRHFSLIDKCYLAKIYLMLFGRFLLGRYGSRGKLIRLVVPLLSEEEELKKNLPPSEGRIEYFAVSPKYQGQGVGRKLMDRFVQHAARWNVQALSVFSGESVSFGFYERYGFQRWAEFHSPFTSYLHKKPIKGFSYRLLLHEGEG